MGKYIIYLGVYVLLLTTGCFVNYDEVSEQIEDNPALADVTTEDNMVSENNTENGTEKELENETQNFMKRMLRYGKVSQENFVDLTASSVISNTCKSSKMQLKLGLFNIIAIAGRNRLCVRFHGN